jgi:hypothetical protein
MRILGQECPSGSQRRTNYSFEEIIMILSASRRTDLPAFYSEWFLNRLRAGFAYTRNPMNRSQVSRIPLSPEVTDCIVFWTKDPAPLMDSLSVIDSMGYHYYFQFTLTPYGKEIEQNLRDKQDIIQTFITLSKTIGKEKVLWRYDPVILNDSLTIAYHQDMFERLCRQLKGFTEICTISFVDLYTKLNQTVKRKLIREITEDEIYKTAGVFSEIGREHGIEIRACSEKIDLTRFGIKAASCIDKQTIEKICGYTIASKPDSNQRPGCGCIQSIDIGVYNTCKNGCIYCYANHSSASIEDNFAKHNPNSEILIGSVGAEEKIITRDAKLLKSV